MAMFPKWLREATRDQLSGWLSGNTGDNPLMLIKFYCSSCGVVFDGYASLDAITKASGLRGGTEGRPWWVALPCNVVFDFGVHLFVLCRVFGVEGIHVELL